MGTIVLGAAPVVAVVVVVLVGADGPVGAVGRVVVSEVPVGTTAAVGPVVEEATGGTVPPVADDDSGSDDDGSDDGAEDDGDDDTGGEELAPALDGTAGPAVLDANAAVLDTDADPDDATTVGVPEVDDVQPTNTAIVTRTPASTADERRPVISTTLPASSIAGPVAHRSGPGGASSVRAARPPAQPRVCRRPVP